MKLISGKNSQPNEVRIFASCAKNPEIGRKTGVNPRFLAVDKVWRSKK
jgi:hypothetical protein